MYATKSDWSLITVTIDSTKKPDQTVQTSFIASFTVHLGVIVHTQSAKSQIKPAHPQK